MKPTPPAEEEALLLAECTGMFGLILQVYCPSHDEQRSMTSIPTWLNNYERVEIRFIGDTVHVRCKVEGKTQRDEFEYWLNTCRRFMCESVV